MNGIVEFLPDLITESGSVLAGILLVIYAGITSLRKRRDISIAELEKRVKYLEDEVDEIRLEKQAADDRATAYQALLIVHQSDVFKLRSVLATNGLEDPTIREAV